MFIARVFIVRIFQPRIGGKLPPTVSSWALVAQVQMVTPLLDAEQGIPGLCSAFIR